MGNLKSHRVCLRLWTVAHGIPAALAQDGGGVHRGAYGAGEQAIAMMASIADEPHITNGAESSGVEGKS